MNQPNVLFLLSDEHSFRFMGHRPPEQGGEPVHTPTFDALAAQSTVFTDAYCQMPLCTPSRLCILTGREVHPAGAWGNQSVLRRGLPTIPQTFAEAGYETCLVGKMHLGGNRQFAGFRHRPYGDLTGICGHQWEPLDSEERHSMRSRTRDAGVTEIPESMIQDQVVVNETVAFLREHHAEKPEQPWLLCASFSRPHFPLTAPRRHLNRYAPDMITRPRVGPTGDAYNHPMSVGMRTGFSAEAISDDEMMAARAAYFACVSYLDEVIGDLFLRLEASGLLDNTIIVYTTDHGEMAGEHGVWWKNGWYEACTRVPLIISLPEQRAARLPARKVQTPVALTDLFPTLCRFCGITPPNDLDGRDLSAAATGEPLTDRPVFCDALTPRWGKGTEFRSIRWRTYKYIVFRDSPPLFFDLSRDPDEQYDLSQADLNGDVANARSYLESVADTTIDFDQAQRDRQTRDAPLASLYAQNIPSGTGNAYLMPSGKLVNADDVLYNPNVLAERPDQAFSDMPLSGV